jgi:hypothetical protein
VALRKIRIANREADPSGFFGPLFTDHDGIIFMLKTGLCRPVLKRTHGSSLRRPWRRLWDHGTYLAWQRRHPNVTCG